MKRIDTVEEKKEYLKSYRETKYDIESIRESINELRSNRMNPSLGKQDGMPRGNGSSDLSGYAVQLDELERMLRTKIKKSVILLIRITTEINEMESVTERSLLRYRYICGLTWEQIMRKMDYSWGQIHNIHRKALQNFKKSV